jgi:hypothetical protein
MICPPVVQYAVIASCRGADACSLSRPSDVHPSSSCIQGCSFAMEPSKRRFYATEM